MAAAFGGGRAGALLKPYASALNTESVCGRDREWVMAVDPLLYSAVRLICEDSKGKQWSATGLFYARSEDSQHYLITNRHVISNPKTRSRASRISLVLQGLPLNEGNVRVVAIDVENPNSDRVLLPPDARVDLAAVAVDVSTFGGVALTVHLSSAFPPKDLGLGLGVQVIVLGYPYGHADPVSSLPFARTGMIATPFGSNYEGQPKFALNGRFHEGMSGSPVLTIPSQLVQKGGVPAFLDPPTSYLLGVFSGSQSLRSESTSRRKRGRAKELDLDLGVAWYSEVFRDFLA